MKASELATIIRTKTKTNSTTYTDADMLVDVNLFKDEIASKIQRIRPEHWNMPSYNNLVADQREYAFPSDVMNNIVKVSLKFGTASTDKFVRTFPIKRNDYLDTLEETKIVNDFTNDEPNYFIRRKAIYILSGTIISVTNGILLVYNAFPADLTIMTENTLEIEADPTTTSHGFPREFHELLARRVSIEYKDRNDIVLSRKELQYETDLQNQLDDFSIVNLDQQITGNLPSSTNDDGYDL